VTTTYGGVIDFLAIGGADVFAGDEGFGFTEDRLIDRLIEGDANFAAAGGPDGSRLRLRLIGVADLENPAFALRAGAPVGWAAVTADEQIALGREAAVDGEHIDASRSRPVCRHSPPKFSPAGSARFFRAIHRRRVHRLPRKPGRTMGDPLLASLKRMPQLD
jgi:hypothetical protein